MAMATTTAITVKSVSAGGISVLLLSVLNDVEFIMLLITGVFASTMSYIYDWTHRSPPLKFGLLEFTELIKSIFYGIPMMFIVYHFGINNTQHYIDVPNTVWGFIAMLCAGSAVTIVEWFAPIIGNLTTAIISRKK